MKKNDWVKLKTPIDCINEGLPVQGFDVWMIDKVNGNKVTLSTALGKHCAEIDVSEIECWIAEEELQAGLSALFRGKAYEFNFNKTEG